MNDLLHFPESFPLSALSVLAPIVRTGKVADKVEAGEAALTLLGYGMGQWLGHEHAAAVGGPERMMAPVSSVETPGHGDAMHALSSLEHIGSIPEGAQAAPVKGKDVAKWAIKVARFVLPLILGI